MLSSRFRISSFGALLLGLGLLSAACGGPEKDPPAQPDPVAASIVAFTADPEEIAIAGESTSISWTTKNAVEIALLRDGTTVDLGDALPSGGSIELQIDETSTFELIATGKIGEPARAFLVVTLLPQLQAPVIGAFDVPAIVGADENGLATVTLGWTGIAFASEIRIEADGLDPISIDPATGAAGSVDVEIREDTRFTLIARNDAGETRDFGTVRVVALPSIDGLVATPSWVGAAESFDVSWSTTGAARVEMDINGVAVLDLEPTLTTGSLSLAAATDATIELRAFNEAGGMAVQSVEVTVAAPLIESFGSSKASAWVGEILLLSWKTQGGNELSITSSADGAILCETRDLGEIAESDCEIQLTEAGPQQLHLSVSNASGIVSESISLVAGTGPAIEAFSVLPALVDLGEPITVGWTAHADPDGVDPVLVLTDDRGGIHPLPAGNQGSAEITLAAPGAYAFTLKATTSNPVSVPAIASASSTVFGLPTATLVATPTHYDDTQVDEIVLTWTSSHAERLEIFEVLGGTPTLFLDVPVADRASGSHGFIPMRAATYRIVATNGKGTTAEAEVAITRAPTELVSFTATPNEIVHGESVLLEWSARNAQSVSLDILGTYLREEKNEPFLDVQALGGVHLPLTECSVTSPTNNGCQLLLLPGGFAFPFGGTNHSQLRVFGNGVIGFTAAAPTSTGSNSSLPTSSTYQWVNLAPFWDALGWDEVKYPAGNIWYLHRQDPRGDSLVVQWKDVGFTSHRTASLNFEVVLWSNGNFEYRYGKMDRATGTAGWERGTSATIGYQLPDLSDGNNINYNTSTVVRGRLEGRTFAYTVPPTLAKSGSLVWHPYTNIGTIGATLTAMGDPIGTANISVTMLNRPTVDIVQQPATAVAVGTEFRIGWESSFATALEVLDASGTVRCTADSQQTIDAGFCLVQEATEGTYTYTVRATGARTSRAEKTASVTIHAPFGIDLFEADTYVTDTRGSVELRWLTTNAAEISLTANGVELLPSGSPSGPGLFRVSNLSVDTTYVLTVTNSLGLRVQESFVVEVWKVTLDLTPSATSVRPGTQVDIAISSTTLDGSGNIPTVYGTMPMADITATAPPFQTISTLPGAQQLNPTNATTGYAAVTLPSGFTFPYYGVDHGSFRVFVDGYLSFTSGATYSATNQPFPNADTAANANVHLAPFWDDLAIRPPGTLWTAAIDADTFAIEWRGISHNSGSSATVSYDLNFQVVLHRDGSFEYRYGVMNPPPATSASCYPNTCVNESNGASATIGYQMPGGASGMTIHYGGTNNALANKPFPGGLAGRAFRYQPVVGSGTVSITPEQAGSYVFCTKSGNDTVCKTIDISADFRIDTFVSSNYSLGFGESAQLSWTTTGGTELVIRENDAVIATITDTAIIDAGMLPVQPSVSAIYTLELKAGTRRASATKAVTVSRLTLTTTPPPPSRYPGERVPLSWNLSVSDPGLRPVIVQPMAEVQNLPFSALDISADPTATTLHGTDRGGSMATLTFETGFTFKYLGRDMSRVYVSTEGFLSFDSAATATGANARIPSQVLANSRVHLAPFWEDLHTRTSGRVFAKRVDPDTYVIQWSRTSVSSGSSATNEFNLNFQVVLRRNGDFEFRYGTMQQPPLPGTATDCYPASCVNEANGSSATIGFQDRTATVGHLLHFGGAGRAATNKPMPGGLSNRTWKFTHMEASGSVDVTPTEWTEYWICAIDPVTDEAICAEPIQVDVPWGIQRFEATPEAVVAGNPVTVDWDVAGLDDLVLEANGVVVASEPASVRPTGSFSHTPTANTTYVLRGSSLGRVVTQTRTVELRTVSLNVNTTPGRNFPGDTVVVAWDTTTHGSGAPTVTVPFSEIDASPGRPGAFIDASTMPGATLLSTGTNMNGHAMVTLPFSFPYFGSNRTDVQVYVDGYLSFTPDAAKTGVTENTAFPNNAANPARVHLAPFWDDLFKRGHDTMWTYQPDPDTFVIQWKNFNRSVGSTATSLYDLNFEVVLFANGSFEYRYATMNSFPPPATHSSCFPSTCVNETNASSATIGYQTVDALLGMNLHFGGTTGAGIPISGGLANRSFRVEPAARGSAQVKVGRTQSYEVCAILNGYKECKTITIDAVANPGDLLITEMMIDPAGGGAAQWFEVRNLTDQIIDLEGFTIASDSGSHTILQSLPVPPHGFVTLASSAAAGVAADYLYGSSVVLNPLLDSLELRAGIATIASVSWDGFWFVPAGRSLNLDPSYHLLGAVSNDDFARWCTDAAAGTPGILGAGCRYADYDLDPSAGDRFIDISATGTRLPGLEDDAAIVAVPFSGFSMPFFDRTMTKIWASSNGWISFSNTLPTGATTTAPTATALPRTATAAPAGPLVAAFWSDLKCERWLGQCAVHYDRQIVGGEEVLILQWTGFTYASSPGSLTVQVQLWERGDIAIAFGDVISDDAPGSTAWNNYHGNSAWVGLEAPDTTTYISAHHRQVGMLSGRTFSFLRK